MRGVAVMNDYSEIQHGQSCIANAWKQTPYGGRLRAVLDRLQVGLVDEIVNLFDGHQPGRFKDTYLLSICEHGKEGTHESKLGRLSMWRAYGGNTNVAFVFNNRPFFSNSNALSAYSTPVLYATEADFVIEFARLVENLENNFDQLAALRTEDVVQHLFFALHFAVVSTKHPGFAEEREWRVVHCPSLWPSQNIDFQVHSINGVPQKVYTVKLQDHPTEGFVGATLPDLLEEIIIGPTEYPDPIYQALVHELVKAGVSDAAQKVRKSNIPLRR